MKLYHGSEEDMNKLAVLKFDSANKEWLEFVVNDRKNKIKSFILKI